VKISKPAKAVLIAGLAIRLGLAPFTGHPGDMALFGIPQRLFYQIGSVDLNYFPTLPTVYYIQLMFYAPYQMLRLLGMADFQYYYHTTLMIESLFLKLPSILGDVGIFLVLLGFTKKSYPATLFFLNPFPICLSAVWGTYDSLMLFPLLFGLYSISFPTNRTTASLTFVVSGLFKLFGFVAFALALCDSIIRRHLRKELPLEVLGGMVLVGVAILPLFFFGGYRTFLQVIVFRFIGLSSGTGGTRYGILGQLFQVDPSGILPVIPIATALCCIGYSYESTRKARSNPALLVKWILVAGITFNILSAAEPQWLSWLVPLGILYGSVTGRVGLQYFAYIFGTFLPFLIITLLQGTAYMVVGTGLAFTLPYVEGVPGLFLYGVMTTALLIIFCAYFLSKKLSSFRPEIIPIVVLLYLQAYFWIVIVGVDKILGLP
jgi:hypothetical protein